MPAVKLQFTAYQGMCEGSQAEGSLGQSVRAVNQTKLAGGYFKKIDGNKIFPLRIFPHCVPTTITSSTPGSGILGHFNVQMSASGRYHL